jgi:alkylation response protein AidB-like acyl-CoA dehydrogenase
MEIETRYHPDADQLAIAGSIGDALADLLPLARLHSEQTESAGTWKNLEEIGLFTIGLGEEHGGSGLGAAEEALIAMALGRWLAAPSILATMGAVHGTPHAEPGSVRKAKAAYRSGGRIVVVEDAQTDLILLREENSAALIRVQNFSNETLDDHNWSAELREISTVGETVAQLGPAELLRLRLIDAAALAGIAESASQMAVAYAGLREQFGRPIGSFQAIKHHCANMAMAARCARDQMTFAAVAVDQKRPDAVLQVECALHVAGTAALENAAKNIQIHGGIGFSDEADPHLLLKRAQIQLAIAGGLEAAASRIADLGPIW